MPLLLDVPYAEKDEAKALGAWWNPEIKKWYAPIPKKYYDFKKWFQNTQTGFIVCDHLFIAEGTRICFRCGAETKVIGLLTDHFMLNELEDKHKKTIEYKHLQFIQHITNMPNTLARFLYDKYRFSLTFSRTINASYYANHCSSCDVLQGDHFLYDEMDSPFAVYTKEWAASMTIYEIPLAYDLELCTEYGYTKTEKLIQDYSTAIEWCLNVPLWVYYQKAHLQPPYLPMPLQQ